VVGQQGGHVIRREKQQQQQQQQQQRGEGSEAEGGERFRVLRSHPRPPPRLGRG
jgi:hypothetical protein